MSLYKDASLVMIPSAYKDGKLYSIRPTDGSGDFTFSRGSNLAATRVNVNGLIEKGRENVLLQSNNFTTTWGRANNTLVSGQSGYDGSNDAWLVTKIPASYVPLTQSVSVSGVNTFSFYAKAGTAAFVRTYIPSGNWIINFDFASGNATNVGTTTGLVSYSMTSVGNGWYRCSSTHSGSITEVRIYNEWVETNASTYYVQDAQLEQGLVATDYIETGTSAAQSGILEDMPRLDYSGGASCPALLLEPQRTNILRQSEYLGGEFSLDNVSLDYNYGTSPEGVSNSALLTQIGSAPSNSLYEFGLPTTDGSYTYSFFFKAGTSTGVRMYVGTGVAEDFNPQTIMAGYSGGTLNILFEDYGDGWWRASATKTLSGASTNRFSIYPDRGNQGRNVEIWGAQVESGSYPTSYIPTYGTSQTRSADDFVLVLATDIAQNGGTFMIELEGAPRGAGTSTPFIQFNHTNSASYVGFGATGNWRCRINDNGTAHLTTSPIPHTDNAKLCIRYGDFGYEYYANGSSFDTYGNAIELGDFNNISFSPNDVYGILRVKQFLTFPTALTDSECIALTS